MGAQEFQILTSSNGWRVLFGVNDNFSIFLLLPVAFIAFFLGVLFPLYFVLGFSERKLAADLQARVGPNRTPGNGALQVFADLLKLGSKNASGTNLSFGFNWFTVQNGLLYSIFVFLPFGSELIFLDSDIGAFLPFIILGSVFLCSLFAGEGGEKLENEILAHRESFLWISGWIPAFLAVMIPVAYAGGSKWSTILSSQATGPLSWVLLSSPFGFIGFFVFLLSGLVTLQLPPFHSLDRGFRSRSGIRLGFFGVNQFYLTFVWCLLATGLFLGGQTKHEASDITYFAVVIQFVSSLLKASFLFLFLRVVARALPQLRQDQMTEFCWRVLTPVVALCLVGELIWVRIFSGGAL
jgi:NADH-quinone oxidoreductase subunit H